MPDLRPIGREWGEALQGRAAPPVCRDRWGSVEGRGRSSSAGEASRQGSISGTNSAASPFPSHEVVFSELCRAQSPPLRLVKCSAASRPSLPAYSSVGCQVGLTPFSGSRESEADHRDEMQVGRVWGKWDPEEPGVPGRHPRPIPGMREVFHPTDPPPPPPSVVLVRLFHYPEPATPSQSRRSPEFCNLRPFIGFGAIQTYQKSPAIDRVCSNGPPNFLQRSQIASASPTQSLSQFSQSASP